MDFQDLSEIATKTTQELSSLWDTIGVSQLDRQKKLDAIIDSIKGVYTNAVSAEQQYVSSLKHDIARSVDRIEQIRSQLNLGGVYARKEGTLSEQSQKYAIDLQQFEELYAERTRTFRLKLEQLHSIWDRMGEDYKENFTTVGATINEARLNEIVHEVEVATIVLEERYAEVQSALDSFRHVAEELYIVKEANIYNEGKIDFGAAGEDAAFSLTRYDLTARRVQLLHGPLEEIGIHRDVLEELHKEMDQLYCIKHERVEYLNCIAQKIKTLWSRLGYSDDMQAQWISKNSHGSAIASLRACLFELNNLLKEKELRMSEIIIKSKQALEQVWLQAGANDEDRKQCHAYFTNEVNDQVFKDLEDTISVWHQRLEAMQPLFALIEKRESVGAARERLSNIENDPLRFKKTQLLKEAELLRNTLKSRRPAIVTELYQSILLWEQQYGQFCPNGNRYLDVILAEDDDVLQKVMRRGSNAPLSDATNRVNQESKITNKTSAVAAAQPSKRPKSAVVTRPSTAKSTTSTGRK